MCTAQCLNIAELSQRLLPRAPFPHQWTDATKNSVANKPPSKAYVLLAQSILQYSLTLTVVSYFVSNHFNSTTSLVYIIITITFNPHRIIHPGPQNQKPLRDSIYRSGNENLTLNIPQPRADHRKRIAVAPLKYPQWHPPKLPSGHHPATPVFLESPARPGTRTRSRVLRSVPPGFPASSTQLPPAIKPVSKSSSAASITTHCLYYYPSPISRVSVSGSPVSWWGGWV